MTRQSIVFEPRPSQWPALGPMEVHVWNVDLTAAGPAAGAGEEPVLSEDEIQRARRFYAAEHGRRFAAAHAALRQILAGYTGTAPGALRFGLGEHGKPHLEAPAAPLQFNLSHSGDRALVAVATVGPVGVDIECHRELSDRDALARRHFSPAEVMVLDELPDGQRTQGFFRCWSRKEAFIKCIGRGLTQALDSFDVSLAPGDARLLAVRDPDLGSAHFDLWDLDAGIAAGAALAVRGRVQRVCAWQW